MVELYVYAVLLSYLNLKSQHDATKNSRQWFDVLKNFQTHIGYFVAFIFFFSYLFKQLSQGYILWKWILLSNVTLNLGMFPMVQWQYIKPHLNLIIWTLVVQFIFNSICSQYINKRVHKWLIYTQVTRDTLNSQWRLLTVPPW